MAGTHNVYIVELDKSVLKHKKVQKLNPNYKNYLPPLYIGMSGISPEERFLKHKAGIKSNVWVQKYGLKLRPEMYKDFHNLSFAEAEQTEEQIAKKMRAKGYPILGGNPQQANRQIKKSGAFIPSGISAITDGLEREHAWANFSKGKVIGGLYDGGKDVVQPGDKLVPNYQVKSSITGLNSHLAQSFKAVANRGGSIIPVALGDPPTWKAELERATQWNKIRNNLHQFGGWVHPSYPNPDEIMRRVIAMKSLLENTPRDVLMRMVQKLDLFIQGEKMDLSKFPIRKWGSVMREYQNKIIEKKADWSDYDAKRKQNELPEQQARIVKKIQDPKTPGLVLFHGMGSGKTRASLEAYRALKMPADVIVPAALQENYRKESKKWLGKVPSNLNIVSQQRLANPTLKTKLYGNGLQIVDEAQKARNDKGELYQALAATHPKKRLLLSGTPMVNNPAELSNLVNLAAGKNVLPSNPVDFRKQYFTQEEVKPGLLGRLTGVQPGLQYKLQHKKELSKILDKYVDYYKPTQEGYPTVTEQEIRVPMGSNQQDLYNSILGKSNWWTRYKVKHNIPPGRGELEGMKAFLSGPRQVSNSTSGFTTNKNQIESPKIDAAFKFLQARLKEDPTYKAMIYSNYLNNGIKPYEELLKKNKIPYGEFSGEIPHNQRDQTIRDYNANKIKALLVSGAGAEGLDLKATRLEQLLDPHWNLAKERQVIGRGARFHSHDELPPEKRNLLVQRYFAEPKPSLFDRLSFNPRPTGTDEYIHNIAKRKDQVNQEVTDLIAKDQSSNWIPSFSE